MKIVTNEKVYIQKKDISYILSANIIIPNSTFIKLTKINILENGTDKYDFVEFNHKVDIEYFKNLSFIINYNDIKYFSEQEILLLQEDITKKRNTIFNKYNSLSKEEKRKNSNLLSQCDLLLYKINSLNDTILYKQGLLNVPKNKEKKKVKEKSKNA